MKHLNFLIKPASSACNLRCRYCFYADEASARRVPNFGVMSKETAGIVIKEAFSNIDPEGTITFSFQGGEPTLAGIDFYRFFIKQVSDVCPEGIRVHYAMQTNGCIIDEEWADFLAQNQVLVGISLDGTKEIHDMMRVDTNGKGSWNRGVRTFRLLQRHGVEVNLLCVVGRSAARRPRKIYHNLKKLGARYLQFIACLDPIGDVRGTEDWSLTPELYGRFLCDLFDAYYQDWKSGNYTSIRLFDDYVHLAMGMPSGTCATSGSCGAYYVIEADGGVYPCDFYALDEWKLGEFGKNTLQELQNSNRARTFYQDGKKKPEECKDCRWYRLCFGGCKRDWIQRNGQINNYLCPAFQSFFLYAESRIREMAQVELWNSISGYL